MYSTIVLGYPMRISDVYTCRAGRYTIYYIYIFKFSHSVLEYKKPSNTRFFVESKYDIVTYLMKFKFLFSKKTFLLSVLIIILLEGAFLGYISREEKGVYIEIEEIQTQKLSSFQELSSYFQDVAIEKGAGYAYDVLKTVSLPPNIDMHLMAHVVGDILYVQAGLEGIKICTHDFRNACSHTIVIGLFFEKGEAALSEIAEACYKAPGGGGAYTMCFHGLGHGVLAYAGYDLEKAVELCKKTGTVKYNNEESSQCISGTIMEIINGVHNRELWEKNHEKYFKEDNPLYPCSSEFIPDGARPLCYSYLTPHLFNIVGVNEGFPTPDDLERAFALCDKLPVADLRNRGACYGGFGKEFIVLALGRDIRASTIEQITNEQLHRVYEWCLLANTKKGAAACVAHATNSLYWGGENDRSMAIAFCSGMGEAYYQRSCFVNLIDNVSFYINDQTYKREFCEELPSAYYKTCQTRLW